jgi:hypothetical protein
LLSLLVFSTVQYVYHVYLFSAYDPSLFDMRFTLCMPAEWVQEILYPHCVIQGKALSTTYTNPNTIHLFRFIVHTFTIQRTTGEVKLGL